MENKRNEEIEMEIETIENGVKKYPLNIELKVTCGVSIFAMNEEIARMKLANFVRKLSDSDYLLEYFKAEVAKTKIEVEVKADEQ